MGDGNLPVTFAECLSGQEAECKQVGHESSSDDVPRHIQAERALSEEPSRKRKRKTNRPQRYRPKEGEEATTVEARQADLYVVIKTDEGVPLNQPDCEENIRRKRSERLKEQKFKIDSQPVTPPKEKLGSVVRPKRRKKRRPVWGEIQPTWNPSVMAVERGLVLIENLKTPYANTDQRQIASALENGEREDDDQLRPWESSTLPLFPVWPYRVYAPVYVPDAVEAFPGESMCSSVAVRVSKPEEKQSRPIAMKQPERLERIYANSHTAAISSSLCESCGPICYPSHETGSVVIAKHPNLAELPSAQHETHAANQAVTAVQGSFCQKRTSKDYMRSKRADPNFRAAEVKLTRERMQRARQDPEYREKERARHREQQRNRRSDPLYAARVRERQKERHRLKRLQSTIFRQRERERQREYMRARRANPEYREKERDAKRSRKRSGQSQVEDTSEPGLVNKELVYSGRDEWPVSSVASETGGSLKSYWNSQVNCREWTMANADDQTLLSCYNTAGSTSSSFSSLREGQSNSDLNAFKSSPSIRYVQYDADRDSDGAGGCRIGSSPDTPESPCTSQSVNSGVSISDTSIQDCESEHHSSEQFEAADHHEHRQSETVSQHGTTTDERTCNSAVGVDSDIEAEVMRAGRVIDGVAQPKFGADPDP